MLGLGTLLLLTCTILLSLDIIIIQPLNLLRLSHNQSHFFFTIIGPTAEVRMPATWPVANVHDAGRAVIASSC
jgi:hypothetical protein